jgi:hypothetical protein
MKKNLLLLLCVSSSFVGVNAQVRKSASTKPKPVVVQKVVSENDLVTEKAETWFKTVYVESAFKDPYSYKHLKTIITTKKLGDALKDTLAIVNNDIDTSKLKPNEVTDAYRAKVQSMYDNAKVDIDKGNQAIKDNKDDTQTEYLNKRLAIQSRYGIAILGILRKIDLYRLAVEQKKRIETKLSSSIPEELDQFAFYQIQIDCYSKNSLGNDVLGRFQFPFNKSGFISSNNGLNNVKQINKE